MSEPRFIYEMVDASSDEMFYPLAIFETLEEAVAELDEAHKEVDADDDYIRIAIRERRLGRVQWSGIGREVASKEWVRDYESDGYKWKALRGERE